MTGTFSGPNYEISIEQEYTHYNCEAPDPHWEFTDSQGHVHRWVQEEDAWSVPTVQFVVDGKHVIDGDAIEYGHWECLECCDTVCPGHRREDRTVPGIMWIEGTVRTNEEFPIGEPLEAALLGLPLTGTVILTKALVQDGNYEFSFRSHGECEFKELQSSHSR